MLSGGKLGGGSELAEKVGPQAACWEEGDRVMLSLCHHLPLRRRGPERRHCHGGKKKMALRWCPGKPRRGVQAAVGAGAALGWRSSGLLPWGGPRRVCSQPSSPALPPLFFLGLAAWLPSQFLCSDKNQGQSSPLPLPLPEVCLGSPSAFVSLYLSPSLQSPAPPSHPLLSPAA